MGITLVICLLFACGQAYQLNGTTLSELLVKSLHAPKKVNGSGVPSNSPILVVEPSNIKFYLYTQENINSGIEVNWQRISEDLKASRFDSKRTTFFCTHGYSENHLGLSNTLVKNALLAKHNVNVFLVDWGEYSTEFYTIAVTLAPDISANIGRFIEGVTNLYNIPTSRINLYGHSIGAHIIGNAAASAQIKANYFVASDPALPLFYSNNRLNTSNANFVHVIHCNNGLQGYKLSIGHADYFPNGRTMEQRGCGVDLFGACAHERAFLYYAESILENGFLAKKCDSYEEYEKGSCDDGLTSMLGGFDLDVKASGDYYLDTNETFPFNLNKTLDGNSVANPSDFISDIVILICIAISRPFWL